MDRKPLLFVMDDNTANANIFTDNVWVTGVSN